MHAKALLLNRVVGAVYTSFTQSRCSDEAEKCQSRLINNKIGRRLSRLYLKEKRALIGQISAIHKRQKLLRPHTFKNEDGTRAR
jgi:hypothetical protein